MLHHGDHHTNARTILAFIIFLLAVMVFLVFYTSYEELLAQGTFNIFFVLIGLGFASLIGLLYLASKNHEPSKKKKSSKKKK